MSTSNRETPEQAAVREEKANQQKVLDDEKARIAQDESIQKATSLRDAAVANQRMKAQGAMGRSSTILTSPNGFKGFGFSRGAAGSAPTIASVTGLGGFPVSGAKTLLGM